MRDVFYQQLPGIRQRKSFTLPFSAFVSFDLVTPSIVSAISLLFRFYRIPFSSINDG